MVQSIGQTAHSHPHAPHSAVGLSEPADIMLFLDIFKNTVCFALFFVQRLCPPACLPLPSPEESPTPMDLEDSLYSRDAV